MHRRWYARFGSLLLAAWFVCYATEPLAALHHCPMHDGTMGTMSMDASGAAAATGAPHGDQRHVPLHHTCTCMGDCAGAPLVGFGGASVAFTTPVAPAAHVPLPAYPTDVAIAPPHALPFPNGPPIRA